MFGKGNSSLKSWVTKIKPPLSALHHYPLIYISIHFNKPLSDLTALTGLYSRLLLKLVPLDTVKHFFCLFVVFCLPLIAALHRDVSLGSTHSSLDHRYQIDLYLEVLLCVYYPAIATKDRIICSWNGAHGAEQNLRLQLHVMIHELNSWWCQWKSFLSGQFLWGAIAM